MSSLVVVLHGHLPYVHHPEHRLFLEEDWYFEAMADCYLPLLRMLDGWRDDGVEAQITMGLSPTLLSMMATPLLQQRLRRALGARCSLAQRALRSVSEDAPQRRALWAALHHAECALQQLDHHHDDIPAAFAAHHRAGRVELMTCGASHGVAPVLLDEGSIRAQVQMAIRTHERILQCAPRGMWLPECGVHPIALEEMARAGLVYTCSEDRALLLASPPSVCGVHRPVWTPSGVAVFARDPHSAKEVWSATEGYPGDFRYREFYRDLGYDAADHQLDDVHKQGTGARKNCGVKLHRITGAGLSLDQKDWYDPDAAAHAVRAHAEHFVGRRLADVAAIHEELGVAPCITAAFDAELFGHWWFEGPMFLDEVMRRLATSSLRARSTIAYLANEPRHQLTHPAVSSWGDGGGLRVWVNEDNDWLWFPLHQLRMELGDAARTHGAAVAGSWQWRALRQATREVMLAQSSDWPFIIAMGTQVGYAVRRPMEHVARAQRLLHALSSGHVDEADMAQIEERDHLFEDVDPHWFAG
jgi:1,4-alpha-glucan branching enzyme